jgi:hypothetical protein
VLVAMLGAACGGQTGDDHDSGGSAGAAGAPSTPSDEWVEIVGTGLFCIRSREGRVLCGSDKSGEYDLSYYRVDGLADGVSLAGRMGATWASGEVKFLGAWVDGYPGTEWLVPPSAPTFGVAMLLEAGYCSFPEPPPAVPECEFGPDGPPGGTPAFPPGRKFLKVAGDWDRSEGRLRVIGITEERTLWCNYLGGDDCHAAFGLDPDEHPVTFDFSTTVVITDWGRAFRHSQPAFDETAEPDSELLRPAPAPDAFLVAALSQGAGFLDSEGRLLFSFESSQNATFYRTDTGEVEDLTALRFRGVMGGAVHLCGILESGFVNCWSSSSGKKSWLYAPEEALPPP